MFVKRERPRGIGNGFAAASTAPIDARMGGRLSGSILLVELRTNADLDVIAALKECHGSLSAAESSANSSAGCRRWTWHSAQTIHSFRLERHAKARSRPWRGALNPGAITALALVVAADEPASRAGSRGRRAGRVSPVQTESAELRRPSQACLEGARPACRRRQPRPRTSPAALWRSSRTARQRSICTCMNAELRPDIL